ncbi:ubiquitin-conjugating enzyme E2 [Pelomyxa schiedti]|nr:ubiquitin-conjugating enzyme E2 [Pelomyxa schiedti]
MASDTTSAAPSRDSPSLVVNYSCFWLKGTRKVSVGRGSTVRDLRNAICNDLLSICSSPSCSTSTAAVDVGQRQHQHPTSTATSSSSVSSATISPCVRVENCDVELALVTGDGGVVVVDGPLADVHTLEECGVDVSRLAPPVIPADAAASPSSSQVGAYAWLCCDKARDGSPNQNVPTRSDVIRVSTKYPIPGATYKEEAQSVSVQVVSDTTEEVTFTEQTQLETMFYFDINLDLSKATVETFKKEIERATGIPVPMQTIFCNKEALSQGNLSELGITSSSQVNLSVDEGSLHRFGHCSAYQPFQSTQTLPGMAQFLSCLYTISSHFSSRLSDFSSWSLACNDALLFPPAWIGLHILADQGSISSTLKSAISCYFWEIFRQIVPKDLENGSDNKLFEHSITCFGILLQGTLPNTRCPFVKESLVCSKSFERVFDPVVSTNRPLNRTSIAKAERQCAVSDKQTLSLLVVSRQKALQVIIWKTNGTSVCTQTTTSQTETTNSAHQSVLSLVQSVKEVAWESVVKMARSHSRTSFPALRIVATLNLSTAQTPCITLDESATHSVCLGPQPCSVGEVQLFLPLKGQCEVVKPEILAKTLGSTKRDVIVDEREVKEAVIVALDMSSSMRFHSFSPDDQTAPPLLNIPTAEANQKIEKLCQSVNGHYLQKIFKSRGICSKITLEVSCFSHKWKSIMSVQENKTLLLRKFHGPKFPSLRKKVPHPESSRIPTMQIFIKKMANVPTLDTSGGEYVTLDVHPSFIISQIHSLLSSRLWPSLQPNRAILEAHSTGPQDLINIDLISQAGLKTFHLRVWKQCTVGSLISALPLATVTSGPSARECIIIFSGRVLSTDSTLEASGVVEGSTVYTPDKIIDAPPRFHLTHKKRCLKRSFMLSDYGITNKETLQMEAGDGSDFHEGESVNVTVNVGKGELPVQFHIDAGCSVRTLKLKTWLKTGLAPSAFSLWRDLVESSDGVKVGTCLECRSFVGQHCVYSEGNALSLKVDACGAGPDGLDCRMTRLDIVKQLFNAFINRSLAYNYPVQIGLVLFSDEPSLECDITPLFEEFRSQVESAAATGNTALFSAINLAASTLNTFAEIRPKCTKRILCLTDGEDTCSKELPHEIANLLQTSNIILDSIMICEGGKNHGLHAVCKATGGLSFVPESLKDTLKLVELETLLFSEMRPPRADVPLVKSEAGLDSYKNLPKDVCNDRFVPKHQLPTMLSQPCSTIASTLSRQATETTSPEPTSPESGIVRSPNQVRRILSELAGIQRHAHPDYQVFPCLEDVGFWRVIMRGPSSSPYSRGCWLLYASFPVDYPLCSPEVRFVTPIVHCNINPYGRVCHSIFGRNWTSDTTMAMVLDCVYGLLLFPETQDPLDSTLAHQFFADKTAYEHSIQNHIFSVAEAKRSMEEWVREITKGT